MFKCDKCGQCCRNIKGNVLYASLDRGDGICKFLKGNICSIYNERPVLCRIDECYDLFYKDKYTLQEYYEQNYKVCNYLKKKNKLCF